jgi:hypothetical protein
VRGRREMEKKILGAIIGLVIGAVADAVLAELGFPKHVAKVAGSMIGTLAS